MFSSSFSFSLSLFLPHPSLYFYLVPEQSACIELPKLSIRAPSVNREENPGVLGALGELGIIE
jgi:hypothetical protein